MLIDKIGIDAFREMVEEELEGDWVAERDFSIDHLIYVVDEEANAPAPPPRPRARTATAAGSTASATPTCARSARQGFSTVEVKVTRGDLTPEQLRGPRPDHARVHRRLGSHDRASELRAALGPRRGALRRLQRLGELGLADAGADEITDVVSCPGTDSCKLGITASMGLNRAIQERVEAMEIADPLTKRVHIKMSGCPNGCSQHHIANIGFYGASLKVGGRHDAGLHPAPRRQLRGRRGDLRPPAQGAAARQAGARGGRALAAPLRGRARRTTRRSTTSSSGSAPTRFEEEVKELTLPAEFSLETMNEFIDWNRSEPYKVERGEGECAV